MATISALFAGVSAEMYESARGSPVTLFGSCGYVYNSHHDMLWSYGQTKFADAITIFNRNIESLLVHIGEVQQRGVLASRSSLYSLITESMTALEKFVHDIFMICFQQTGQPKKAPSLSRFFAWHETFSKNFVNAFDSLFIENGHYEALKYLAAFRNCIVHQSGIIDKKTIEEINDHPNLTLFRESAPLPIDLETVISLADSVTQWCKLLIEAADHLLKP